jgi:dihydrofolate reductase
MPQPWIEWSASPAAILLGNRRDLDGRRRGVDDMRVVVINHVSLDGVMQAPGRADEDTRNGFAHGGWAMPGNDEAMGPWMGERMGQPDGALLSGRRSYEDVLRSWNSQPDNPFVDSLNATPKYVVSSNSSTALPWPNSSLLVGDVPAEVAKLKERPGGNLVIMGSGALIHSLLPHRLIDEYMLMIHPLLLGTGLRLFPDPGTMMQLQLASTATTATGVILATYEQDER